MVNQTATSSPEEPLISMVTIVSLLLTVLQAVISYGVARLYRNRVSREDFWVLMWLVYDVLIHFTLELPFVVVSLLGTVDESDSLAAQLWKEYAKADRRWGVSDPTIVALEILTTTVVELFAVLTIYGMVENKFYRHYMQICLCVSELYGGWMTFCPEWLTGSASLSTDNPLHLWVYLVFFNGLWVVIPLYLMWQSWRAMRDILEGEGQVVSEKEEKTVTTNTYRTYNTRSKTKLSKGE